MVTCQAPLSMGFPRQEYWSGLPFPSPGDLPSPGVEPTSPELAREFFATAPPGKPHVGTAGVEQVASGKLLCHTGSSAQCSAMNARSQMGWEGRLQREGLCIYL